MDAYTAMQNFGGDEMGEKQMGEEKKQDSKSEGKKVPQGRRAAEGRSSIYGSKESVRMMQRSAHHRERAGQTAENRQTAEKKQITESKQTAEKKQIIEKEQIAEKKQLAENKQTTEKQKTEPENKKAEEAKEQGTSPKRRMSLVESERENTGKRYQRTVKDAAGSKEPKKATERKNPQALKKLKNPQTPKDPVKQTMDLPGEKQTGSHTILKRCLLGFGGVILVIYIAVAVYFSSHFYEDTEIYGIDCSQKSIEEVKSLVSDKLDEYRLEIKERGSVSEYLTADQIDLKFVDNSSIDRMAKAQKSYIWPIMLMMGRGDMAGVAFSYDQRKALTAFKDLECMNPIHTKMPTDAYIQVTESGYEIVKEPEGNTLNPETTAKALYEALDGGKSVLDLETEDCYLKPELYSDDEALVEEAEAKDKLVQADITYDFGDRQERVNAPVIAQWITQTSDGSYVIDDVKVTDYVESLAAKYDTFGLPRQFYTSLGTTVTLTDGDYGWCMDQDATVVDLLNALAADYQGTMEPQYTYTAMSRSTNDIGDTYVEICISQQVMWCYKDGVCIVYTPVVTGNPNKGNATPSNGVWSIDAKMQNYTLVGEGYRSPVDFWMPFNGNVGIHDMQTRAYFGGTIYLTNGSHGCVNTPYQNAKIIYENVSIGTPVIVYD